MRMPGVALVLALAVTGCAGGSTGKEPATAPADHGGATAQNAVLTKALARFKAAGTGSYESEVTADGVSQPLAHETGLFTLRPVSAQLERAILGIDQSSSEPRVQVVRIRSTAARQSFLQLKEWGTWTGCWLPMDVDALSEQTGVDLASSTALPTAIGVLARATVSSDHGLSGPHLAVDAYSALQFLGVTASALAAQRDALSDLSVPVLLDVTSDGDPSGAAVEGSQVADVLEDAGLALSGPATNYVAKSHARVVLDDLGETVRVVAPSKTLLLAADAPKDSTCPANR